MRLRVLYIPLTFTDVGLDTLEDSGGTSHRPLEKNFTEIGTTSAAKARTEAHIATVVIDTTRDFHLSHI